MKILVISLPDSHDRRIAVTEKLGGRGIPFEFLDAVNGKTDQHPYFKNYQENRFLINRRRKAAPGELGCYVSHLLAWEKCLALNEAVVVLEDDFEMTDKFLAGLQFVRPFLDKVSFVRLEPLESKCFITSASDGEFSLVKQYKVGMCATGYIITPQGAAKLLQTGRKISAPIDLYLKQTLIHKQLIHALIPAIVYPTHADTLIGWDVRNIRQKGVSIAIKRFVCKWFYATGSVAVNLLNAYTKF